MKGFVPSGVGLRAIAPALVSFVGLFCLMFGSFVFVEVIGSFCVLGSMFIVSFSSLININLVH